MPFKKKSATPIIDSRHIKVIAAKKSELHDSIVFICLSEEKYGHLDEGSLMAAIEQIDNIQPNGVYFPMLDSVRVEFYEMSEFANRDLVITIKHSDPDSTDLESLEETIREAISNARSIKFIHQDIYFEGLK